jgi:hypothetical protein
VHQELCVPEENCEEDTGDTEPTDAEPAIEADAEPIGADAEPIETDAEPIETNAEPMETDAERPEPIETDAEENEKEPAAPPLELDWYLGVSENLKVRDAWY